MGQLWFIAALAMLGSDSFEERERGQFVLQFSFPLSQQVVAAGLGSVDLEVSRRCKGIIDNHNRRIDEDIERSSIPEGFVVLPGVVWIPESVLSYEARGRYIEMASREGYENSGTYGQELHRRATMLFLRDWLGDSKNRSRLKGVMREAKANEIAWHNMLPLTTIPDRLDNLPTREK